MKMKPMGDYYVWFCEWCDSRNATLWAHVATPNVCCSACQQKFHILPDGELLPSHVTTMLTAV